MAVKKALKSSDAGKSKTPAGETAAGKPAVKKVVPKKAAVKKAAPKKRATKKAAPQKTVKKPAVTQAAVKKDAPAPPPAPAVRPLDRAEFQRQIRVAAYYKFMKRGHRHGKHLSDWYEAEKEITSKL